MDKQHLLNVLNRNKKRFSNDDATLLVADYLTDKGVNSNRILEFITYTKTDFSAVANDIFVRCIQFCIEHYIKKYNINSVSKNNEVIYYY